MSSHVTSLDMYDFIWSSKSLKSFMLELVSDTVLRSTTRNSSRVCEIFERWRIQAISLYDIAKKTAAPNTPNIMESVLSDVADPCVMTAEAVALRTKRLHWRLIIIHWEGASPFETNPRRVSKFRRPERAIAQSLEIGDEWQRIKHRQKRASRTNETLAEQLSKVGESEHIVGVRSRVHVPRIRWPARALVALFADSTVELYLPGGARAPYQTHDPKSRSLGAGLHMRYNKALLLTGTVWRIGWSKLNSKASEMQALQNNINAWITCYGQRFATCNDRCRKYRVDFHVNWNAFAAKNRICSCQNLLKECQKRKFALDRVTHHIK